jgi:hypothetical protein
LVIAGEHLGSSDSIAGDYDADGVVDIVAGAPGSSNGTPTENGCVAVLSAGRWLSGTSSIELYSLPFFFAPTQHGQDYHFGAAVHACADLKGDSVGEILAGAPDNFTAFSAGKGGVAAYSGANGIRIAFIQGATNDRLGAALAGAVDDLDGDGFPKFAVAGAVSDPGGSDSGVVKCYRTFPIAPAVYCAGKFNRPGCTPLIGFSGTPSASSGVSFLVTATNFVNQKCGLLAYSHAPTGRQEVHAHDVVVRQRCRVAVGLPGVVVVVLSAGKTWAGGGSSGAARSCRGGSGP